MALNNSYFDGMIMMYNLIWLVVTTPLKNTSQMGLLFPIYGKIKFMFQTTNQLFIGDISPLITVNGHHCRREASQREA